MSEVKWYHGGVPGLVPGDVLLPPSETGKSTLLQYAKAIAPDGTQRGDRVYLTTLSSAAAMFAAVYPNGDVYEVVPGSEVEDDPDCLVPDLSAQCARATIVEVVQRAVPMPDIWKGAVT